MATDVLVEPLSKLVFEEAVTHMIDDGNTVDVIYLDFAKVFESVLCLGEVFVR